MSNISSENKISEIIKTIRSWSIHWDLDELFKEIIKNSVLILNADFGYILLIETNGLSAKASCIKDGFELKPFMPEIAEKVIRHGTAIYAGNIKRFGDSESQIYCVPMTANRGVLGVIYLEFINRSDEINQDDKLVFEMLGLQAASFLENSILYHSAITDPLTGLYSHRHFQQECDLLIRRTLRTKSRVTLIIMDLDHFKQLNDEFGHEEGNLCLKRISEILKSKLRSTDIIARFGGDEFELLLPDATTEKCFEIAEEIRNIISQEPFPLKITATIGMATFPIHASDSQTLFLSADQALYNGKSKGRNCTIISDNKINSEISNKEKNNDRFSNKLNEIDTNKNTFPDSIKKDVQRIDGLDIVSRLASSSNGEVLMAKQHELDRFVALKRPLTAHLTEDQANAFKKEAYITASLSHPGVVPLYTMGRGIDGRLYYTMKPIQGSSLEDLLKRWKNRDPQTIKNYSLIKLIHIILKTCETISYAHSQNVAHLDVHPGNIIIGEFGEITLIDWGKGIKTNEKETDDSISGIYISGSPVYRPPEQISKNLVGKFTDVYSLGVILFEVITDRTPFRKNTTKETIEAITNGIDMSDDIQRLHYGIDPLLSGICKKSMAKDYNARLSAADFAKALARFALLEADMKVHQFQDPNFPMKESDWFNIHKYNDWSLHDGVWSTIDGRRAHQLFWKTPITGNFTFTIEGWITAYPQELAIFCFGKSVKDTIGWNLESEQNHGYCFQFGADNNLYTKLARHGEDILVNSNMTIELNKKYTITVSYQDGILHCFIDNKLIFNYRELHPFAGYQVGFYNYGAGSHFKPIEIRYQAAGLMIPAIRLADENFAHNRFDLAITSYDEIITAFPDRLEGLEALLKKGYCLTRLGKIKEAIEVFNKLKGSILEPYAMIEIALIELPKNDYEAMQKDGDYKKAYEIIKDTVEKFPNHQAIFRILGACYIFRDPRKGNFITYKKNMEESVKYKLEILKIGLNTLTPPGHSQLACFETIINYLAFLGDWQELTSTIKFFILNFAKYLTYRRNYIVDSLNHFYSCDELDFIESKYPNPYSEEGLQNSHPIFVIDKYKCLETADYYSFKYNWDFWKEINYKTIYDLQRNKKFKILEAYKARGANDSLNQHLMMSLRQRDYMILEMFLADDKENATELFTLLTFFSKTSNDHKEEAYILKKYYQACIALFDFNLPECLKHIDECNNLPTKIHPLQEKRLLLTACLYNLEYYGDWTKEEMLFQNKIYLAGPRLELANGFLTTDTPLLSNKWPKKPTNLFWDFVVYCIWAYEKNQLDLSKKLLEKLINPKFGGACYQKLLAKLKIKINEKEKNGV